MIKFRYILLGASVGLLAAVACQREEFDPQSFDKEDAISLSSFRQQVFTRADVDMYDFDEGTKYTLLAVDHDNPGNWDSGNGFGNLPQAGVEQVATNGAHSIKYEPVKQYHKGKKLDFYGLAYSSASMDAPVLNSPIQDGTTPTITIGETNDRLSDLMHSNSVKGKSSADGVVTMPFEHALAAVNFTIAKQDESGDTDPEKQLRNVKVKSVTLKGVAETATMNVVDGTWSWTAEGTRAVYPSPGNSTAPSVALTTDPEVIGDADILVFPTYGGTQQVSVEIELEGLEQYQSGSGSSAVYVPMNKTFPQTGLEVVDGACTISYDLRLFNDDDGADAGPLKFERNHKYQMSIFVMRDNVRIVAISPQVYDWEDIALTDADPRVTTLGQPITIGGTVWMDRNLGAKSADCEGDWLHTLGYYYEYARNIPFILDVDVLARNYYVPRRYKANSDSNTYSNNDNYYLCYKSGTNKDRPVLGAEYNPDSQSPVVAFPDYLIYTYDQNGNKVSRVETKMLSQYSNYVINSDAATMGKIVAINPGDTGSYAFIAQTRNDVGSDLGAGTGSQRSWCDFRENTHIRNYWYSVENQPVPKGWRLATAKDVYTVMPENNFHWSFRTGHRFRQVGVADSVFPKHTEGYALEYVGDYVYQYFYGDFEVDKSVSKSQQWSAPIYNNDYATRVYGLKYQGTAKAYRYMIEIRYSNFGTGADELPAGYARFYIYPTTKDDRFKSNKNEKDAISDTEGTYNLYDDAKSAKWNLHQFDWDHPSTYIDFPLQGQIECHPMHINLFGRDMKNRLMETIHMFDNYCMKLSNDGLGFAGTWHSTTGPTRLVRDI